MAGLPRKSLPPDKRELVDRRTGQPKRVSAKLRKAIALLNDGEVRTLRAAAVRVGIHPDYLSRALKAPHVRAFVDERVNGSLYAAKSVAASRAIDLMFSQSEHVCLDATELILGVNGIRAVGNPAVSLNVSLAAPGYCIDLVSDPREAGMKTIEHQRNEAAKNGN